MKKLLLILSLILSLVMTGCTGSQVNTSQRTQMRTKTFEADYNLAFKSVMRVLEVQGYTVENTDISTGLIKADKLKTGFWMNSTTKNEVNSNITKLNNEITEIRLNLRELVEYRGAYGSKSEKAKIIDNPETYNILFNEIRLEIERLKAYQG